MKKIIVFFGVLVLIFSTVSAQVKEHEIVTKDKLGNAAFVKLKETKVNSDILSIQILLQKQYDLNIDSHFKQVQESVKDSPLLSM